MKLINADGMVFIGPGSEWFWTAVSGIVLAVTFYAIYRQLRLQASQRAIDQVDSVRREYESERILRYRLAISIALRDGTGYPRGAANPILNYWDDVGALVRRGHLDANLYWESGGVYCQQAWVDLEPFVQQQRAQDAKPAIGENFEWLAAKMTSLDRRAGSLVVHDEAWAAPRRQRAITTVEEMIRVEEALRAIHIAPPTAPAPSPDPVAEG